MRTKQSIVVLAALGIAGTLVSSWHDRQLRAGQEIALAEIRQKRAAVEARIRLAERSVAAGALTAGRGAAALASGDAAGAPEIAVLKRPSETDEERRLKKELWFAAQREKNAARFAPLFRTLGLSAETIGQFHAVLEQQRREMEDRTDATDDPQVALAKKLRGFLSDAEVGAALEFERALPVRDIVSSFAGAAALAGDAFSADQAERLTAVILEVTPRGGKNDEWLMTDGIDWSAVDARGRGILSETQLDVLKRVEPSWNGRFGARLHRAMDEARKADAAKAATAPTGGAPAGAEAKPAGEQFLCGSGARGV